MTEDWMRKYVKRHEHLALVTPRPLDPVCTHTTLLLSLPNSLFTVCQERILYRSEVDGWFETAKPEVEHTIPDLLVNMDETYVCPGKRKEKVVVHKGNHVREIGVRIIPGFGEHISLVAAITASGDRLPSMVILPHVNVPAELRRDFPQYSFKSNKKGWMTAASFHDWTHEILIPFVTAKRAELRQPGAHATLVVDAHVSRACSVALNELRAENIAAVCMIGHATHVLQPLDVAVFATFKKLLHKHCHIVAGMSAAEKRHELLRATTKALYHACEPDQVRKGFALTGLCPWDPEKILESGFPIADGPRPKQKSDEYITHYIAGKVLTTDKVIKHVQENEEKAAAKKAEKARKTTAALAPAP